MNPEKGHLFLYLQLFQQKQKSISFRFNPFLVTMTPMLSPTPDNYSSYGRKRRNLTHSYDKRPNTHRKIKTTKLQHKNATKNLKYTTIVDRLRDGQLE